MILPKQTKWRKEKMAESHLTKEIAPEEHLERTNEQNH